MGHAAPAEHTQAPPPPGLPQVQAVILAAGLGRRMRPLPGIRHKALLPIGATTILGRAMDSLTHAGVRRVTVVTGYRAREVEQFLRTGYPGADLHFVHNARFADTNNVVSLSLALDNLTYDCDVVLIECDLLFSPALLGRLLSHPARNVALVDRYRTGMDGTVVAVRDGLITAVYPAGQQGADFTYASCPCGGRGELFKTLNIYKFAAGYAHGTLRPLLRACAEIDRSCYYELVLGMLTNIADHRISAEIVTGEPWLELDTPNDIPSAVFEFEPERRADLADHTCGGFWNFHGLLDFTFMANAYFPTGAMLAAMRHALPELAVSYGSRQVVLNEKLGHVLGCAPCRLQVLHGASQAFPFLPRALGRNAAIPAPAFGEYGRAWPRAVRYTDAPGVDWAAVGALATPGRLVVLVNPNSVTGTTLASKDIYELARSRPGTMFLADESFLPFAPGQPSLTGLLEDGPLDNVVVLASLSKTLGVPGLRLGYLYSCNRRLIEATATELPVWNLSSLAEFFLEQLAKFAPAYEASLAATARDRETFASQLRSLPLIGEVYPSGGNFLLTRLQGTDPRLAGRVRRWLLSSERIAVKDVTGRFRDRAPRLRFAVRSTGDNTRLAAALSTIPDSVLETA